MTDFSQYIGIPYVAGGESFAGCDCWGIVQLWYRNELGITLGRPVDFAPPAMRLRLTMDNYRAHGFDMVAPPVNVYQPGDVLLLQHGAIPDNFAVVVDGGRILTMGVKTGSLTASVISDRVVAVFRRRDMGQQ
jgi:murein DD-endopeptidase